jgi:hypothetical protein
MFLFWVVFMWVWDVISPISGSRSFAFNTPANLPKYTTGAGTGEATTNTAAAAKESAMHPTRPFPANLGNHTAVKASGSGSKNTTKSGAMEANVSLLPSVNDAYGPSAK